MKIALQGYGKMGKLCEEVALRRGHTIVGIVSSSGLKGSLDNADVLIDFSVPEHVVGNVACAIRANKSIVIGTTGWLEHLPNITQQIIQSQIGLLYSPNFSRSVAQFHDLITKAAQLYRYHDAAAVEMHHQKKLDAPSGTAKSLAQALHKGGHKDVPISSVRVGHVPGTHTIIFDSPHDTITLTHAAHNRQAWAEGALDSAEWLLGKQGVFTFHDVIAAEV